MDIESAAPQAVQVIHETIQASPWAINNWFYMLVAIYLMAGLFFAKLAFEEAKTNGGVDGDDIVVLMIFGVFWLPILVIYFFFGE